MRENVTFHNLFLRKIYNVCLMLDMLDKGTKRPTEASSNYLNRMYLGLRYERSQRVCPNVDKFGTDFINKSVHSFLGHWRDFSTCQKETMAAGYW